jgi:hypothetical protein
MTLAAEDILAIQKLVADYNHFIDVGEADAWADLFVEDGSLDSGMNVTKGRAELREFARVVPTLVPGSRHVVANLSIDGDGDEATTKMYLQMWATAGGTADTKLVISGRYHDTLRREGATWRFVARTMIPDS